MKTFWAVSIAGSILLATVPLWADLPDLEPIDLEAPATVTAAPNPSVQVTWAVINQGNAEASGYWSDILYISTRPFYDSSAVFVSYAMAPSPVEAGDTYWSTNTVTLPITESGTWYLILYANAYNYLQESDTSNNTMVRPVTFVSTPADLAALNLVVPSTVTGPPNPYITVVHN
jgi:hypothetical protein